jgi:hypothetical protein
MFRKDTNETVEKGVQMVSKEKENPIEISVFESIRQDILRKISKTDNKNPAKEHNDFILIEMDKSITNAENELAKELKKPLEKQIFKPFLVLKKNYLITLFVLTYIKMQYTIYDEYMKNNKKTSRTMNIELLHNLYSKASAKMEAIIDEIGEKHQTDKEQLQVAFAGVKSALLDFKSRVEDSYE